MMETADVLFDERETASGHKIGVITLNRPQSLNAFTLDMVQRTAVRLSQWDGDDSVAAVYCCGSGERAFCAGGDVRRLYRHLVEGMPEDRYVEEFFLACYRLCLQISEYRKPFLVLASGIVMGGGLGLTSAASFAVVTPSTRIAMPETAIGLYPDAGATFFLHGFGGEAGLFFGLTGVEGNGTDALAASIAGYAWPADKAADLADFLCGAEWSADARENRVRMAQLLNRFHNPAVLPESRLRPALGEIKTWIQCGSFEATDRHLKTAVSDNPFAEEALRRYREASPLSTGIFFHLFGEAQGLSFREALAKEYAASLFCCRSGDFREGVRARLIDKDQSPGWSSEISQEKFFSDTAWQKAAGYFLLHSNKKA